MRHWLLTLSLWSLLIPPAGAASITLHLADEEAEQWLIRVCRFATCGAGTLSQRAEMVHQKLMPQAAFSLTWDDPLRDTLRDADGIPLPMETQP